MTRCYHNGPYCLSDDNRGGYWVMSFTSTAEFHGTLAECTEFAKQHDITIYHDGYDITGHASASRMCGQRTDR